MDMDTKQLYGGIEKSGCKLDVSFFLMRKPDTTVARKTPVHETS